MAKKISGSVGKGGKNKPENTRGQTKTVVDDLAGNWPPRQVLEISAQPSTSMDCISVAFPGNGECVSASNANVALDIAASFQGANTFQANELTSVIGVRLRGDNVDKSVHTVPEPSGSVYIAIALGASLLGRNLWFESNRRP